MLQPYTEQGADARRSGTQDEHRVFRRDVRDAGCPKTGGKHIAHKQCRVVAHAVRNRCQPLVGIGDTDVRRLSAVDAASECPAPVGVGTIVHIAVTAEEAFAAECLYIDRHTVAGTEVADGGAGLFDHTYHLMAYGDAGHGTGNAAMFDVQVAGTDAATGHTDDGVAWMEQGGTGLVGQSETPRSDVSVCFHERVKGWLMEQK